MVGAIHLNRGVRQNEKENERIFVLSTGKDVLLEASDVMGPRTLVRGMENDEDLNLAAAITARYGKARTLDRARVSVSRKGFTDSTILEVRPASKDILDELKVGTGQKICGQDD